MSRKFIPPQRAPRSVKQMSFDTEEQLLDLVIQSAMRCLGTGSGRSTPHVEAAVVRSTARALPSSFPKAAALAALEEAKVSTTRCGGS